MEYWDIYDRNKQLTGRTMQRNDWNMKDGDFHLTVLGVIHRSDGRFLITQRVLTKAWAPGWWEVPGGGVRSGETSKEALIRELKEETGLDISESEIKLALTYMRENPDEGDNYFVDVYRIEMDYDDKEVCLQQEEALSFLSATHDEIFRIAKEGRFLHYDSIKSIFA